MWLGLLIAGLGSNRGLWLPVWRWNSFKFVWL